MQRVNGPARQIGKPRYTFVITGRKLPWPAILEWWTESKRDGSQLVARRTKIASPETWFIAIKK